MTKKIGILLVMLVMFGGCIGGPPQETTSTVESEAGTTVKDDATSTVKDDATSTVKDDATSTVKDEADTTVKDEADTASGISFEDLFNLGKPTGYTVEYDITMSNEGWDTTMTQKHYVKDNKLRMDSIADAEGQGIETRAYSIPKGTYMCSKAGQTWTCFGSDAEDIDEGADTGAEDFMTDFEGDMGNVAYDGTQQIAGVNAVCYKYSVEGEWRVCVHPTMYLSLLVEGENFQMIAKSVDLSSPADSVFELPAEPMDLGDLTGDPCAICAMMPDEESKADCLASCK